MNTRQLMQKNIADLKEQLADAIARGDHEEAEELRDELASEEEGLSILIEGFTDLEVSHYSRQSGIENVETEIANECINARVAETGHKNGHK